MPAPCVKHPMADGDHACGTCGHDFCTECVVFPFGLARPPMCITCALEVGGVRRRPTDHPRLRRREVRRRLRSRRGEPEAARGLVGAPEPELPPPTEEGFGPLDRPEELPGGWHITY